MTQVSKKKNVDVSGYLPGTLYIQLVKLGISSQLWLPNALSYPWYCHVLTAVTVVRDTSTAHQQISKGSKLLWLTHFQDLQIHKFLT